MRTSSRVLYVVLSGLILLWGATVAFMLRSPQVWIAALGYGAGGVRLYQVLQTPQVPGGSRKRLTEVWTMISLAIGLLFTAAIRAGSR